MHRESGLRSRPPRRETQSSRMEGRGKGGSCQGVLCPLSWLGAEIWGSPTGRQAQLEPQPVPSDKWLLFSEPQTPCLSKGVCAGTLAMGWGLTQCGAECPDSVWCVVSAQEMCLPSPQKSDGAEFCSLWEVSLTWSWSPFPSGRNHTQKDKTVLTEKHHQHILSREKLRCHSSRVLADPL